MENGSFQHLNLSQLDFVNDVDGDTDDGFLVTSLTQNKKAPQHQLPSFKEIPKDVAKSSSVQALLSQNEDLMARLKVTIQRLTTIEDENRAIQAEFADLKQAYSVTSDQMLVWKEKERVWKERNQNLEKELQSFKDRFPEYKTMEEKIERYKRYQEKVKNHIKPYVHELKAYAQSLHQQIVELNREADIRETKISDLEHKLTLAKEEMEQQVRFYEINQNDLVASFEKERNSLFAEIKSLNEANQALELKSQKLDRSLERQDELENLVISLRRTKEDYQNQVQAELAELRQASSSQKASLTEKELILEDLKKDLESTKAALLNTDQKKDDLQEQLTSLRFMWTQKSEENEKLKAAIASLEKINLELSNKLNKLRKEAEAEI